MKSLSKLAALAVGVTSLAFVAFGISTVSADSPGQLAGGSSVYEVKNLTQNDAYATSINASACDEVQYSIMLHNAAFGSLSNVTVKASLPSGSTSNVTSNMVATTSAGGTTGTSGSTTINISSAQTITYENGSAQLFDSKGALVKSLADTITSNGVNIGTMNGSTTEFVNFKAKISCPTPPVTPPKVSFACIGLDVAKVDRTRFDFTAHASVENASVQSFGFTAKDANGKVVDSQTVNTNALSAVYNFNQSTAGTYTVSAVVNTDHGSTSANSACTKQVIVEAVPTPPTTPVVQGKTTELPNTGPGDVLGIFAGASSLGAAGHFAVRRFRK